MTDQLRIAATDLTREQELWTFQDAIDHLLDVYQLDQEGRQLRNAKRAVLRAHRGLCKYHAWNHYFQLNIVNTVASYSTGTITYDHCVTPEHEALTRDGWKTHSELRIGDEILAYDHESEMCSWKPIEKLHVLPYSGKILDIKRRGRRILACTPNHKFPAYRRSGRDRRMVKEWVKAKDLTSKHNVPLAAPLETESCGAIDARLSAVLAWLVTDGSGLFNRKYHKCEILQSAIANPRKCEEIELLVRRQGRRHGNDGMLRFPVLPEDKRRLRELVDDKASLPSFILTLGVQECEAVVRAMRLAESSTNPSGQKVFSQWGDNKPVAEAFQMAAILTGYAVNICEREYGGKSRYQCTERTSKHFKPTKYSEWVDYDGVVWCPQVATGAWVVRCNGSVSITGNSGGTNEREVTLATGTWPTWAAYGQIRISNTTYDIESRVSDTVITLPERTNPGADVAAGTSYEIFRSRYPLPINWRRGGKIFEASETYDGVYLTPQMLQSSSLYDGSANSSPWRLSIQHDPKYVGAKSLVVSSPPSSVQQYVMLYERWPNALQTPSEANGEVTVNGSPTASAAVTGTGTSFASRHKGAVIRLSDTSVPPTTVVGSPFTADNLFAYQRIITTVTDTTNLVVDSTIDADLTSVSYTISDPLDIDPETMLDAFLALAEWEFSRLSSQESSTIKAKREYFREVLDEARAADNVNSETVSGTMNHYIGAMVSGTISPLG